MRRTGIPRAEGGIFLDQGVKIGLIRIARHIFFEPRHRGKTEWIIPGILLLIGLSWICCPGVQAGGPVSLPGNEASYALVRHLEYLEDPTGTLTISEVASPDSAHPFLPGTKNILSLGETRSAFWARVSFRNDSDADTHWRLEVNPPSLDFIDLWVPDGDGRFLRKKGGDRRPFRVREVNYHSTVFKLTLPARSERTVYLRFQNNGLMIFDLRLWQTEAFYTHARNRSLVLGLFFGALMIVMGYNLFLFGALRDYAYLYYVLFLFSMAIQFATFRFGLSLQFLWPNSPEFNQLAPFLAAPSILFFAINFAIQFLRTRTTVPALDQWLRRLRMLFPVFILVSTFHRDKWLVLLLAASSLGAICLMVLAGVIAWRKGFLPARYYLLAWGLFWGNTVVAALHISGAVSIPGYSRFLPVVVAVMMLFLSLALADRINQLQLKTEYSRRETARINRRLKEHQERLVRSEKKYRNLFERSSDLIFLSAMDGRIEDINPACETLLGIPRSEALQVNISEFYADPSDRDRLLKQAMEQDGVKEFQVRLRRRDGRDVFAMITAGLRHDESGELLGLQGIVRDITAQTRVEEERKKSLALASAKEVAEAASKAKSDFLANMSHELRTPLNAILGFARVLSQNTAPQQSRERDQLSIILRNGEHLLSLINQVLDLSKIEAGKMTLNETGFDLHRFLGELEKMFALRARQKNLILRFHRNDDLPRYILADEIKLRQILINLLKNAVKFTESGTVSLRSSLVRPEPCPAGSNDHEPIDAACTLIIEVEDTGVGIAQEETEAVFEAFEQTESGRRKEEGTGLGLQISRRFARLMGGDIQVKSEPGNGSLFTVEIPVRKTDLSTVRVPPPLHRITGLTPGQADYRFLIADDQPDNRLLLATLLHRFGFKTREAKDGREAVTLWREWHPHLIWMDMRMPVMDGYEAVRTIRSLERGDQGNTTRIIAVTAESSGGERSRILSCGCDDMLTKPFEESLVFEVLENHLGIRFISQPKGAEMTLPPKNGSPAGSLSPLPGKWLDLLEKGAAQADFILLSHVVRQIRKYDRSLSTELESMVKSYRYGELLKKIQLDKQTIQEKNDGNTNGK